MVDEQPPRTRPDEASGEFQRAPIAVPADQLSPPGGPAFVRRHPVGVAVGVGATGFIFGAILTALFLPILLAGPMSPGPFPMPAPPPCGFAPGGCGAPMPPPQGWAGPAGGWGAPAPLPRPALAPPPPGQLPPPPPGAWNPEPSPGAHQPALGGPPPPPSGQGR